MSSTVTLLHTDGSVAFADVPADQLLATRATMRHGNGIPTVVSHRLCEHFEGHGTCNRGTKCRFVHRASAAIPRRHPATVCASEKTGTIASAGSGSSGRHGDAKRRTDCASNFNPAATSPRDASCGPPLGSPLLPQEPRSERPCCVQTPRGWRHPAYDAKPLASLH